MVLEILLSPLRKIDAEDKKGKDNKRIYDTLRLS